MKNPQHFDKGSTLQYTWQQQGRPLFQLPKIQPETLLTNAMPNVNDSHVKNYATAFCYIPENVPTY